jgi:CRP-like cAMP-binding protein
MSLQQIAAQLQTHGVVLRLAGLSQASELARTLRSFGLTQNWWPDADRAIEAAEKSLLVAAGVVTLQAVPLASCTLLHGLDAEQLEWVLPHLQAQELQAGEVLFHQGAKGDRLFVLVDGSVSVVSNSDKNGRTQRYVSISPGMLFGETAIFDDGGRTAAVVADAPATVYALTLESLDALDRAHPALGSRLHRNIALHLSQRLRNTTAAWYAAV